MDPQQVRNRYNEMNSQVPRIEYLPEPPIDLNQSNRDQIRMRAFWKTPSPPRKLHATCSQGGPSRTSTQVKVPVESSREPTTKLAAVQRPPNPGKEADISYHTRDTQTDLSKWEKRPARPSPKGPSISASLKCNEGSHHLRKCGRHQDNKAQTDKCLVNPRKYHALLRYIECGRQDPENRQPLYIMVPNSHKLEQQNKSPVKLDQPMEVAEITPPFADLGPNYHHNISLERNIRPSTSPREQTVMVPPSLKVSIPLNLIQPPTCWEKQFLCVSQLPRIIWSPKVPFNTEKRTVKQQVELNRAIEAISDTKTSKVGSANRLVEAEKMRIRMMEDMRIELFGDNIEVDKKQGRRDRKN